MKTWILPFILYTVVFMWSRDRVSHFQYTETLSKSNKPTLLFQPPTHTRFITIIKQLLFQPGSKLVLIVLFIKQLWTSKNSCLIMK